MPIGPAVMNQLNLTGRSLPRPGAAPAPPGAPGVYDVALAVAAILVIVSEFQRTWPGDWLWDFGSFVESGRAAAQGLNPYGIYPLTFHVVLPGFDAYNPNLNPPISALLFQLFDLAEPHRMFRVWYGVSVALYAVTVLLLLARYKEAPRPILAVWALALAGFWDTLLLGQVYIPLVLAAVGAFARASQWYEAGQGLHFGLDFTMPCGTPLVAVAEGEVMFVDDFGFGSEPHNLILRHEPYGLTTLYGHLLDRPLVEPGQFVERGQVIGYSGDPDLTCVSRPHLHLEVRSLDYFTAYNPVESMNAAWNSLSNIGSFSSQSFQRDLDNARRWMTLFDQPQVAFGGGALNNYAAPYPPLEVPPNNPPPARRLPPLPEESTWQQRRLGSEGCCFYPWWDATNSQRLYAIDGSEGVRASILEWRLDEGGVSSVVQVAPPAFTSPVGTHEIRLAENDAVIQRRSDGAEWRVNTNGNLPAVNTDNTRLMWLERSAIPIPGEDAPRVDVWVSGIDGSNPQMIVSQDGGYAVWLDAARLLIVQSEDQVTTLSVADVSDGSGFILGAWERLRGISVAPGGGRLMFYLSFYPDEALNGVYTLRTEPDEVPRKMPWFGSWRWRDADSVYYIPFDPTSDMHQLAYYHIPSGDHRLLTDPATMPFTIANGDWSVSPDGNRVAYLNATDMRTWILEPVAAN